MQQKQNNNSKEDPFATEDEDEQASDADAKGHHDLSFKKQKTRGQSRMAELSAIASMVEDESEDDMPLAELLRRTRPAIPMSSEAIEPRKGNSRFSNVKVEDGHESEALVLRGGSIATGGIISAEAESSPSFSGLSSTGTDFVEEGKLHDTGYTSLLLT